MIKDEFTESTSFFSLFFFFFSSASDIDYAKREKTREQSQSAKQGSWNINRTLIRINQV